MMNQHKNNFFDTFSKLSDFMNDEDRKKKTRMIINELEVLKYTDIKKEDFIFYYGQYQTSVFLREMAENNLMFKKFIPEEIILVCNKMLDFLEPIADLLPFYANGTATEEDWEDLKWEQSFKESPEKLNKNFEAWRE